MLLGLRRGGIVRIGASRDEEERGGQVGVQRRWWGRRRDFRGRRSRLGGRGAIAVGDVGDAADADGGLVVVRVEGMSGGVGCRCDLELFGVGIVVMDTCNLET